MTRWGTIVLAVIVLASMALAPSAFAQGSASNPPPPPGANDPCRADQRATPVVLVHGTLANRGEFFKLGPQLEAAGYCTFALNYGGCNAFGNCGLGRIQDSAAELRRFINTRALPQSRSGKVSIVGHSQGGLMPRYYLKFLGGTSKVTDMVSFSASNHGTNNPLAPFGPRSGCFSCAQQYPYMASFTRQVNDGDETPGRVDYTQIQTRYDDVVLPYYSAYLADDPANDYNGPVTRRLNGPRTTNYCLQDGFPADTSDHLTIESDDNAFRVVVDALGRPGPARPPVLADSVCARLGGDPGAGGSNAGGSDGRPACTIRGTDDGDVIRGTQGNDVICAGAGNDVVHGRGGNDYVYGGTGNDALHGDAGADHLFGQSGNDAVTASDGVRGNDAADGGSGSDSCAGDQGDRRSNCP